MWRDLGDVVVSPLPLLLLELDGDSSDGAALDPFHQVGHIPETNRISGLNKYRKATICKPPPP